MVVNSFYTFIDNGIVYVYQKYQPKFVIAGDSVASYTNVYIDGIGETTIDTIFKHVHEVIGDKEYYYPNNVSVLTYDQKNDRTCYKKIKYVMRHKTNKKVYRVYANNETYVDVTEDHSLIVYVNATERKKTKNIIKEIKPTETGSSLVYLKTLPYVPNSRGFCKEVYEFFGYFIGNGSIKVKYEKITEKHYNYKTVGISVGNDGEEFIQNVLEPLKQYGLIERYTIKNKGYDIDVYGDIAKIVYQDFVNCEGKTVPDWLFQESKQNICAFVRGYFSSDGTVINRKNTSIIRLTSVKKHLLKDIQTLLFQVSIPSTFFSENSNNKYKEKISKTKSSHLVIKNNIEYMKHIGFLFDRKTQKVTIPKHTIKIDFDFSIVSKRKIEEIEYDDYVYDIEVEDTHVFFANNFLVHNTDSSYLNLSEVFDRGANKEEVIKFADYIGKEVNNSFPTFMKNIFNVPDERASIIQTDREVVSDRSYFLKKKHYIMHIIDKEGIECDELKIMGVSIKKTTTSVIVQEFLTELVDVYLMGGKTYEETKQFIDDFKQKFDQMDMQTIGVPASLKSFRKYELMYQREKNMKGFPYHVRAALYYNEMCGPKDKKLETGDKCKIIYIQHPRYEYIAIPVDVPVLPDFINDLIIDRKRQWETVQNQIDIFLEPIGYNRVDRQKNFVKTLLKKKRKHDNTD